MAAKFKQRELHDNRRQKNNDFLNKFNAKTRPPSANGSSIDKATGSLIDTRRKDNIESATKCSYLNEANFFGVTAEALSAAHKSILPDNSMRIPANTAEKGKEKRDQIN